VVHWSEKNTNNYKQVPSKAKSLLQTPAGQLVCSSAAMLC